MVRRAFTSLLAAALAACRLKPQSEHEKLLARVRKLVAEDRLSPNWPEKQPREQLGTEGSYGNGTFTLIAGVWVEDRLFYEAFKVPMGTRPLGDDVRDLQPGIPDYAFSRCGRCQRSWKWVEGHITRYGAFGCFPLCERCWQELKTPEARLPYYRELWDSWKASAKRGGYGPRPESDWLGIEAAVRQGL